MKYITFCELSKEFLEKPMEQRKDYIQTWNQLAKKHRVKVLFWGMPMGVKEQLVYAFEVSKDGETFFKFEREWLGLGTPEATKLIKNLRTITVY